MIAMFSVSGEGGAGVYLADSLNDRRNRWTVLDSPTIAELAGLVSQTSSQGRLDKALSLLLCHCL